MDLDRGINPSYSSKAGRRSASMVMVGVNGTLWLPVSRLELLTIVEARSSARLLYSLCEVTVCVWGAGRGLRDLETLAEFLFPTLVA
jgi:hypothetical protein